MSAARGLFYDLWLKCGLLLVGVSALALAALAVSRFLLPGIRLTEDMLWLDSAAASVARITAGAALILAIFYVPASVALVRRLRAQLRTSERMASNDSLTGLANRFEFRRVASAEASRSERFAEPWSLLLIDIHEFRTINEDHGYSSGDAVLIQFADLLVNTVRSIDTCARFSGDDFAILLPGTDDSGAIHAAEKISRIVAQTVFRTQANRKVRLAVSIGVASSVRADFATCFRTADDALLEAKMRGPGQVQVAAA